VKLVGREISGNLAESSEFHATLGIFYMPQIYDMGQAALLPLRSNRAEDFFALKNPTASAGSNPGTKGQHATPRPPKPLSWGINFCLIVEARYGTVDLPLLFPYLCLY
jgi:hypothetical protein